jgi:hypothetical protein
MCDEEIDPGFKSYPLVVTRIDRLEDALKLLVRPVAFLVDVCRKPEQLAKIGILGQPQCADELGARYVTVVVRVEVVERCDRAAAQLGIDGRAVFWCPFGSSKSTAKREKHRPPPLKS